MSETKGMPRAADFMTRDVCTVGPEASLADVIQQLLRHEISNVPVVDEQDGKRRLVGFISEGDCLSRLSSEVFFGNPSPPQTARTIMRTHPVCVAPETELFALASIFSSHGFRHLPVVENDDLVGIVSRRDILKAMDLEYRDALAAREKMRSPPDLREIINQRFVVQGR